MLEGDGWLVREARDSGRGKTADLWAVRSGEEHVLDGLAQPRERVTEGCQKGDRRVTPVSPEVKDKRTEQKLRAAAPASAEGGPAAQDGNGQNRNDEVRALFAGVKVGNPATRRGGVDAGRVVEATSGKIVVRIEGTEIEFRELTTPEALREWNFAPQQALVGAGKG